MSRWLRARDLYFKEDSNAQYPVQDPMYFTGATVYYKGAWVVRMLRWVMGDSLFFAGLRYYYSTYKHGLVDTDDLRDAMAYVAGYCFLWFFTEWTEETGYPVIHYSWSQPSDTLHLVFYQAQDHGPVFQMPVEVMLTSSSDTTWDTVWMRNRNDTFALVPGFQVQGLSIDPNHKVLMVAEQTNSAGEKASGAPVLLLKPGRRSILYLNPTAARVEIKVYDATGRLVVCRKLAPGSGVIPDLEPGLHFVMWPGGRAKSLVLP